MAFLLKALGDLHRRMRHLAAAPGRSLMKILGIAGVVPSRLMPNQDITDLVAQHSRDGFSGDLPKMLKTQLHPG
jgi:hypothetical protein